MSLKQTTSSVILGSILMVTMPAIGLAQRTETSQRAHDRAEREQTAQDHRKHTGAKVVGGSAVGGAVLGGVLGGGKGALIGGNVFITQSVPPYNRVTADPPKLKYRERRKGRVSAKDIVSDFQI